MEYSSTLSSSHHLPKQEQFCQQVGHLGTPPTTWRKRTLAIFLPEVDARRDTTDHLTPRNCSRTAATQENCPILVFQRSTTLSQSYQNDALMTADQRLSTVCLTITFEVKNGFSRLWRTSPFLNSAGSQMDLHLISTGQNPSINPVTTPSSSRRSN